MEGVLALISPNDFDMGNVVVNVIMRVCMLNLC